MIAEKNVPESFEEALQELESIVRRLEDGRLPLEDSLKLYERGSFLKNHCDRQLNAARLKIDEISKSKEGPLEIKPSSLADGYCD